MIKEEIYTHPCSLIMYMINVWHISIVSRSHYHYPKVAPNLYTSSRLSRNIKRHINLQSSPPLALPPPGPPPHSYQNLYQLLFPPRFPSPSPSPLPSPFLSTTSSASPAPSSSTGATSVCRSCNCAPPPPSRGGGGGGACVLAFPRAALALAFPLACLSMISTARCIPARSLYLLSPHASYTTTDVPQKVPTAQFAAAGTVATALLAFLGVRGAEGEGGREETNLAPRASPRQMQTLRRSPRAAPPARRGSCALWRSRIDAGKQAPPRGWGGPVSRGDAAAPGGGEGPLGVPVVLRLPLGGGRR